MPAKNINVELLKAWASHNYIQDYRSLLTMDFKVLKDVAMRTIAPRDQFSFSLLLWQIVKFDQTKIPNKNGVQIRLKISYVLPYARAIQLFAADVIRVYRDLVKYTPPGETPDFTAKNGLKDTFRRQVGCILFDFVLRCSGAQPKDTDFPAFLSRLIDHLEVHINTMAKSVKHADDLLLHFQQTATTG